MPLLPPGEIFHSSASSKFLNCASVMVAPASATRVNAPSLTCQPAGSVCWRYPLHPAPVFPSKRSFHPAARSLSVRVFGVVLPEEAVGAGCAGCCGVEQLALMSNTADTSDVRIRITFMRGVLRAPAAAPARRDGLARCE